MSIENKIRDKIVTLINEGENLRHGDSVYNQAKSEDHRQRCYGYVTAALHLIQSVVQNPENAYRQQAEKIAYQPANWAIPGRVGELRFLLHNLLNDIDAGLLVSVADRARAETFDNFLDHSKEYLSDGRKNEAGVISGVVFEDSLRRICRKYGITEKNEKLDNLISALVKIDVLSKAKAKRARAAAHVRTKATHAQWDEFDENDVKVTIELSEELIMSYLDK